MRVEVPFNGQILGFDIPEKNVGDIVKSNSVTLAQDIESEVQSALENPIGTQKLRDIVKPGQKVVVICEDITRITPTPQIVKSVIHEILQGGVEKGDIEVVMSLGTHRNMTEEEMVIKLGEEIVREFPVFNSEFKDKKNLVYVGRMEGNVPLWVDERVMKADVRVGIGSVVPHPAVGFSGGGKIMIPGVTGEETVAAFHHAYGNHKELMFGKEHSPIRLYMEEMVEKIGLHFIVNAITTPEKKVYKVVAGHFLEAQRKGVQYSREVFCVNVNRESDIVIINSYPSELDFWQATKAYDGANIVRAGGTALLLSPCPEGLGPHERYAEYIGNGDDPEWLKQNLEKLPIAERIPLSGGRTLMRCMQRVNFAVYSPGLKREDMDTAKIEYVDDLDGYINKKIAEYGEGARVSVIFYGSEISAYV
jgi:nickel-dependent lactate racemase